jgi:hypothetical protein
VTTVRKLRLKSRLSTLIRRPGGMTAFQAAKKAEAGLDGLRPMCLAALDETLAEVYAKFGSQAPDRANAEMSELYMAGLKIIDCSIGLPHTDIDAAARALCALADLCEEAGVRDWVAVDVHIEVLRLLRATGWNLTQEQRAEMIESLSAVTRKRLKSSGMPDDAPPEAS